MSTPARFSPLADVSDSALALWEESHTRTPFTHPDFVRDAGEAFGLAPVACFDASGDAALIGLERRRGPLRALALTPATPEAPLLLSSSGGGDAEQHVIAAIGERYPQATLALGAECEDARVWTRSGWTVTTRYTHRLRVDEACTDRWSKTTRWEARRHQPEFSIEWGDANILRAASLEVASYARKELSLGISAATLADLASGLSAHGLVEAAGARNLKTGDIDAAVIFALARGTAWYWIAGSVPGPAMTVLLAKAVPSLASQGVTVLDWAGANVPSVAEFKRKRSDALVPTLVARRIGPRWLRILDALR